MLTSGSKYVFLQRISFSYQEFWKFIEKLDENVELRLCLVSYSVFLSIASQYQRIVPHSYAYVQYIVHYNGN